MQNIVLLGLVSFFSDISSEMVYPLIPFYLTGAFGATPVLVGMIEGIAESLASLLKVFSGYLTDRYNNKKAVAFTGYATGLLYKITLLLASSWGGILVARVIDRMGKGVRTAPRDVLVSESAENNGMGKAFGIHKALDMAGSALGILLSYFLLANLKEGFDYKNIFLFSMIPAGIGLLMMIFVKEQKQEHKIKEREYFWKNIKNLNGNLKLYLAVTFIFTLGNSSNTFLLLRAKDIGFSDRNVVLLYFIYNVTAALFSIPFGKLSDRIGRKKILVSGYLTFALVYFGFGFAKKTSTLIAIFIIYGFYTAMIAGVERAFLSEIAPTNLKGTMLGLQATVVGIALLPASVLAGILWNSLGAPAPFVFGATLSLIAAGLLLLFLNVKKEERSAAL